tara:strand:+ start:7856 stop:8146 length:291 start_codon:yes stop_codon:yes gene_type:complete
MKCFIKIETFNEKALKLTILEKNKFINDHKIWVKNLIHSGIDIQSGYMVNKYKMPGAGGLLMLKAKEYTQAEKIIINDPMILNDLVNWSLNEWVKI